MSAAAATAELAAGEKLRCWALDRAALPAQSPAGRAWPPLSAGRWVSRPARPVPLPASYIRYICRTHKPPARSDGRTARRAAQTEPLCDLPGLVCVLLSFELVCSSPEDGASFYENEASILTQVKPLGIFSRLCHLFQRTCCPIKQPCFSSS